MLFPQKSMNMLIPCLIRNCSHVRVLCEYLHHNVLLLRVAGTRPTKQSRLEPSGAAPNLSLHLMLGFTMHTIDQNVLPRLGTAMLQKSAAPRKNFCVTGLLLTASEHLKYTESSHTLELYQVNRFSFIGVQTKVTC